MVIPTLHLMIEYLELLKDWIIELGEKHDVDPLTLGGLYLVSKVSFLFFLGWVIKNLRSKKAMFVQLLLAAVSFSIPYMYIIIAGPYILLWVYLFIALMFIYGGFSIWRKVAPRPTVN